MPTLGTQNISTSYPQLLKTFGLGGLDGNLQVITDGDNTSSALSLSTTGVSSTGSLSVDGTSLLTGAVTFGASLTVSTGTATIGTLSASTATISTATISTATISTATIPTILGATTFGSTITASTGTNTLGTISGNIATLGTLSVTNGASVATTATVGTAKIGASGPSLVAATYATAAFTGGTLQDIDHVTGGSNSTTGTFAANGVAVGDIVVGSINSIGSTTGITPARLMQDFRVESSNVIRFTVLNTDQTAGTIPSGIVSAAALRFTA